MNGPSNPSASFTCACADARARGVMLSPRALKTTSTLPLKPGTSFNISFLLVSLTVTTFAARLMLAGTWVRSNNLSRG